VKDRRDGDPVPDYAVDAFGVGVRYNLRLTRQTTVRTSFRDLLKKRDGPTHFWALRDVSFRLVHGESLAVIGPNGCSRCLRGSSSRTRVSSMSSARSRAC
jgi:hypothetical protein